MKSGVCHVDNTCIKPENQTGSRPARVPLTQSRQSSSTPQNIFWSHIRWTECVSERPSDHRSEKRNNLSLSPSKRSYMQNFSIFWSIWSHKDTEAPVTLSQVITVLPSYTALKPCALTAKSVVNHKASIDPELTIGDGSMNPDNLERKDTKKMFFFIHDTFVLFLKLKADVGSAGEAVVRHELKHF